jgi:predicted O-methyltransferase YrrM
MTLDNLFVPPGHFYSPIFLPGDPYRSASEPLDSEIPMHFEEQKNLLERISQLGIKFPEFPIEGKFYYSNNDQYGDGDAYIFSGVLKILKPSKVIEIGSGFSTAVLMDTLMETGISSSITTIDPYPQRLELLLGDQKNKPNSNLSISIIAEKVQEVSLNIFTELMAGDILFIDSSHVSKTGSDVNYELFEILPRLNRGVWVHIHDMFWPFEYPQDWIQQGRSWNEMYLVRAFLTGNSGFKIRLFQHYLFEKHSSAWNAVAEKGVTNPGGGLWLEKM